MYDIGKSPNIKGAESKCMGRDKKFGAVLSPSHESEALGWAFAMS